MQIYSHIYDLIDIKPQNLMLSSNNRVKLIDFSNATFVSDTRSYSSTGTPAFMAPELLKKGKCINNIMFHIYLSCTPPFFYNL